MSNLEQHDIVIIGAGPAGLAAALGARRAGIDDVLLLERDRVLGGILNQCIHDGFGLFLFKETISGPEYAERLINDVLQEKIPYETGAMVLDLSKDRILRVNTRSGYRKIQAKAVILAMGCRERTREMIEIPGTRPAGIFTAGSAQNMVNLQNIKIGNEAVILGSGDIGLIMARRLHFEGFQVNGVFELMPYCNGLERNVRQCLHDFDIPLELSTTVVDVKGNDRLKSITVARVGADFQPLAGTEQEISCDTLLLSVGLIPENELSKSAGISLSPITNGAVVDERLQTNVPGIFSCGNVLHIHDVADFASEEGFSAGKYAAEYVNGNSESDNLIQVRTGENVRYCLPQRLHAGVDKAQLNLRVTVPLRGKRITVTGAESGEVYFTKKFPRLLPSELTKITVRRKLEEDVEVACFE